MLGVQIYPNQIRPGKSNNDQREEFFDSFNIRQVGIFHVKAACFQRPKSCFDLPPFLVHLKGLFRFTEGGNNL